MREIGAAGFSEESLSAHLEPLRVERTLKSPRCVGFCACGNVMYCIFSSVAGLVLSLE